MSELFRAFRFFIITGLPVAASYACLIPYWFSESRREWVPIGSVIVTAVLVPGWLSFIAWRLILVSDFRSAVAGLGLLVATLGFALLAHYALWGVSTGRFWMPDNGTLLLLEVEALLGMSLLLVVLSAAIAVRVIRKARLPTPRGERNEGEKRCHDPKTQASIGGNHGREGV
jgi:hypothetical protein